MATYDLDRTELNHLLTPNIDPAARAAVVDYLLNHGGFDNDQGHGFFDLFDRGGHHGGHGGHHGGGHHNDPTVKVQISDGTQPLDPHAAVLDLTSATNTVTTDAALKVIVENISGDADLTVHGTHDVMVVTGGGDDLVTLQDSGNDVVLTGAGNDTVIGGDGHDSIYGGAGNDSLVAGTAFVSRAQQVAAAHAFNDRMDGDAGYGDLLRAAHECSAVTAACLLTRRRDFIDLGGMDEFRFPVNFNDVDYCLKLRAAGKRIVFTPHAKLLHRESASRGKDKDTDRKARFERELHNLRARWADVLAADPFYNPVLSLDPIPFSALAWPLRSMEPRRCDLPIPLAMPPGF